MARVLVLGAGFGGLAAAGELKRRLGTGHELLVVADSDQFVFRPSLTWVSLGREDVERIVKPLAPILERKGIGFLQETVRSVDLFAKRVITDRHALSFDALVVALGADVDWKAIPGMGRYGMTVFTVDQALRVRQSLGQASREPVAVVIGECTAHLTPAYEFALWLANARRDAGGEQAAVHLVTAEVRPMERSGFRVAAAAERELRRAGVQVHLHARVVSLGDGWVEIEGEERLNVAIALCFPPYVGQSAVLASPGLGDDRGLIDVDFTQRSLVGHLVFAVGDATAFPGQKTGQMAEAQGKVAAAALAAAMEGRPAPRRYQPQVTALLELGPGRGLFFRHNPVWDPGADFAVAGRWPHRAKRVWERYYLSRL